MHLTLALGRQNHWCWSLPPVALLRIIINDAWSKMNCSFPEMNAMQVNVFWDIDPPHLLTWTFMEGQRRVRFSSTSCSWAHKLKLRSEEVSVPVRRHWSIALPPLNLGDHGWHTDLQCLTGIGRLQSGWLSPCSVKYSGAANAALSLNDSNK